MASAILQSAKVGAYLAIALYLVAIVSSVLAPQLAVIP